MCQIIQFILPALIQIYVKIEKIWCGQPSYFPEQLRFKAKIYLYRGRFNH